MLPENLRITSQERRFLQKWVDVCSEKLAEDESWEDGVMLKGLQRRMKRENFTPSISDIKQWYITTLVSQEMIESKEGLIDEEKEKLSNLSVKLNSLLNYFGSVKTNNLGEK